MYPGANGAAENHKKGYCADGVQQKGAKNSTDDLPPWPQPQGIFSLGKMFDVVKFLTEVRTLYEKIATHQSTPSLESDFTMEDIAFASMVQSRTSVSDGRVRFRLFDLEVRGGSDSLIERQDRKTYLLIDCLSSGS